MKEQCYKCDKTFRNKASLKRHFKFVHEKIKPHKCEKCVSSFSYKSDLKRHELSVHLGAKFACDKCSKKFSSKDNLNRHLKVVHVENGMINETISQNLSTTPTETDNNLDSTKKHQESNTPEKTSKSTHKNHKRCYSKVKKGQWIVKLERIDISDFVENK